MSSSKSLKRRKCNQFFDELAGLLSSTYELVGSCNQDFSRYLVPNGTVPEITYHSKPAYSFRISDHWNWWANLKKCKDENYVQCRSLDMPWVGQRKAPGMASEPRKGFQVAFCDKDGIYHHVFGEKFDRQTRTWSWVENDPAEIIKTYISEEA